MRLPSAIANYDRTFKPCMHKGIRKRCDAIEITAFGDRANNTVWAQRKQS